MLINLTPHTGDSNPVFGLALLNDVPYVSVWGTGDILRVDMETDDVTTVIMAASDDVMFSLASLDASNQPESKIIFLSNISKKSTFCHALMKQIYDSFKKNHTLCYPSKSWWIIIHINQLTYCLMRDMVAILKVQFCNMS